MLQVYPADERYKVDLGWLRGRPSFSFGDYQDPANTGFGVLRVCNDDWVAPGRGFGAHPHSDMEIVSIILQGTIRHEDNLGHIETAGTGAVQRMSAGTGIIHAEYNPSDTEPLELLQLWFMPRVRGAKPTYETTAYDTSRLVDNLLPVVSHEASAQVAWIGQDMTIYLGKPTSGATLVHRQAPGRRMFLFIIAGALDANGTSLGTRDTARIEDIAELTLRSSADDTFFMLIDMP
ncbi:MAG: pirin family protein [Paenibacillaceae bacterium]|nr:pirin family protein [Paenibacillaceae bacterium]